MTTQSVMWEVFAVDESHYVPEWAQYRHLGCGHVVTVLFTNPHARYIDVVQYHESVCTGRPVSHSKTP